LGESDAVDDDRGPGRHVGSPLRNNGRLSWENAAASASLLVLAHFGRGRIGIHREIGVVRLAADIANLKQQVSGKLAVHRQVPYLDAGGGKCVDSNLPRIRRVILADLQSQRNGPDV